MPIFRACKNAKFALQHPIIFGVLASPWTTLKTEKRKFAFSWEMKSVSGHLKSTLLSSVQVRFRYKGLCRGSSLGFRQNGLTRLKLESQDRSALSRIETSRPAGSLQRLDVDDAGSAKLQACMKSDKPDTFDWRAQANSGNDSNDPAQSGRPQPSWSERERDSRTDKHNQLTGSERPQPDRTGREALDGTSRRASIQAAVWNSCWSERKGTHRHALTLQGAYGRLTGPDSAIIMFSVPD